MNDFISSVSQSLNVPSASLTKFWPPKKHFLVVFNYLFPLEFWRRKRFCYCLIGVSMEKILSLSYFVWRQDFILTSNPPVKKVIKSCFYHDRFFHTQRSFVEFLIVCWGPSSCHVRVFWGFLNLSISRQYLDSKNSTNIYVPGLIKQLSTVSVLIFLTRPWIIKTRYKQ